MRVLITFLILLCSSATFSQLEKKNYTEERAGIMVQADQPEFTITLKSNPTTGYSWFLRDYHTDLIKPVKHEFIAGNPKLMGAPGQEVWTFRAKPAAFSVPQQTLIRMVYARPWEGMEQSSQLVFRVSTVENSKVE